MSNLTVQKSIKGFLVLVSAASLAACTAMNPAENTLHTSGTNSAFEPSDVALLQGKRHFLNGDYGSSERFFRKAVESSSKNANAWIGLAASYDHLGRFKLSKRAYAQAIKLNGKTPVILNNLGYSQLLQGNLKKARYHFLIASEKAPENTHIQNNLALLRASEENVASIESSSPRKS